MLYALVTNDDQIKEYRDHSNTPPNLPLKGLRWLPVADTNPPFNQVTQNRTGPVVTVRATEVTRVWTVANKTAGEIDADKTAAATGELDGMKALKALVIWLAPLVGKTPAQAKAEIIAIYKALV